MTLYTEGFSHFVTSMTAPVASGRSDRCRVGLAPTEERRISTAHTRSGRMVDRVDVGLCLIGSGSTRCSGTRPLGWQTVVILLI